MFFLKRLLITSLLFMGISFCMNAMMQNGDGHAQAFIQALDDGNLIKAKNIINDFSTFFENLSQSARNNISKALAILSSRFEKPEFFESDKLNMLIEIEEILINTSSHEDFQCDVLTRLSSGLLGLAKYKDTNSQHIYIYHIRYIANISFMPRSKKLQSLNKLVEIYTCRFIPSVYVFMIINEIDCNYILGSLLNTALALSKKYSELNGDVINIDLNWSLLDQFSWLIVQAKSNKIVPIFEEPDIAHMIKIAAGKILYMVPKIMGPMPFGKLFNARNMKPYEKEIAMKLMVRAQVWAQMMPRKIHAITKDNEELEQQLPVMDSIVDRLIELLVILVEPY